MTTRNYELDSGAYFFRLVYEYWKRTGTKLGHNAILKLLNVWKLEQNHVESPYKYDELLNGVGTPVGYTGMTWTGFRPSDDKCTYHYHIPDNVFAAVTLGNLREMGYDTATLRQNIIQGIHKYGVKDGMYCYEVDGLGGCNMMDDANVPSLLSLPYLDPKGLVYNKDIYEKTREFILSPKNPYYYSGTYKGIGSPHTPKNHVWHLSLIMQAILGDKAAHETLVETASESGPKASVFHESFHVDNPTRFTRKWFGWADALYYEMCKTSHTQIIRQDNILWSRNWRSATCNDIPNKYMTIYGTEHHSMDLSFARKCSTVWLRLGSGHPSDIETFIQNELPNMQEFRLVTTDGDHSVPTEIKGYETLLNSDKLIGWYTQNYDGYDHPKMHPVPIGFDLHTTAATVEDMIALRDSSSERTLGIIQPPWSYDHPDRSIRHSCVKKFPRMKRNELWKLYTQYTHGLSPHGNGLDCHRTWEMLFFGMIPIVKTSSLDSMYDGLPVVILQDWSDLCTYPLQRLKAVDEKVMTTEYWLS